jgi:hypothetical protein
VATTGEGAAATVRCVVCQEDIRRGAKVCTHCKSAQDFTRHIARWSTVAAAVLGVGSLVSAAYSLWKLVPSPARIEAIALSCQRDLVSLALVNVGDRPGAVRSVALQVTSAAGPTAPIELSPERGDENLVIESGRTATVNYVYRIAGAPSPFSPGSTGERCRYVLSVGAVDFSGKTVPSTTECDCPSH